MAGGKVDFEGARFTAAICTVADVARLADMPVTTVQSWAGQRRSRPQLITRISPERRGWPSVPLVGLAEAASLRGMLDFLPRREVMDAAEWIVEQYKEAHPLANKRLVTDGFRAYVEEHNSDLYTVQGGQRAIRSSIEEHLRPIEFADDYYPVAFRVQTLPGVVIDPRFNAGRMSFQRNRVPLYAVAGSLKAGATVEECVTDYHLTVDEVRLVEQQLEWLGTAA